MRVLAINGSYRDGGVTDQLVEALASAAEEAGAEVDRVFLREEPIEFCLNCRECTQQPGAEPGECVQRDGMQALVQRVEAADAFILAAPTNAGSVTALFKRFMERLIVYTYWPWGMNAPRSRKAEAPRKPALLVSSCAAPGFLGRWVYATRRQLRATARTIGADPVGVLFHGLVAGQPRHRLTERTRARARSLVSRLL